MELYPHPYLHASEASTSALHKLFTALLLSSGRYEHMFIQDLVIFVGSSDRATMEGAPKTPAVHSRGNVSTLSERLYDQAPA